MSGTQIGKAARVKWGVESDGSRRCTKMPQDETTGPLRQTAEPVQTVSSCPHCRRLIVPVTRGGQRFNPLIRVVESDGTTGWQCRLVWGRMANAGWERSAFSRGSRAGIAGLELPDGPASAGPV